MTPLEALRAGKALGGWLLRHWWVALLVGLAIALHLTRGTLADSRRETTAEKAGRADDRDKANLEKLATEARYAGMGQRAAEAYAASYATREPLIIRSTDTVRTYAQTDAGRAGCLSLDRMRGIDAFDAAILDPPPAGAAGSSGGAMLDHASAPPAGRISDQR